MRGSVPKNIHSYCLFFTQRLVECPSFADKTLFPPRHMPEGFRAMVSCLISSFHQFWDNKIQNHASTVEPPPRKKLPRLGVYWRSDSPWIGLEGLRCHPNSSSTGQSEWWEPRIAVKHCETVPLMVEYGGSISLWLQLHHLSSEVTCAETGTSATSQWTISTLICD